MDVGILIFDGADELDVVAPHRVFGAVNDIPGAPRVAVHLIAERSRPVTMAHGLVVHPTTTYRDCPVIDVLVVPGGGSERGTAGRRVQQRHPATIAFLTARAKDARIVASICTGAFLLAETGALAGRRANTHWRYRDELAALMAQRSEAIELVPERVVWDGDVVTGGGVTSGIDVSLQIVARLFGDEVRSKIERALELETPG